MLFLISDNREDPEPGGRQAAAAGHRGTKQVTRRREAPGV